MSPVKSSKNDQGPKNSDENADSSNDSDDACDEKQANLSSPEDEDLEIVQMRNDSINAETFSKLFLRLGKCSKNETDEAIEIKCVQVTFQVW